jgi:hypothetical protein
MVHRMRPHGWGVVVADPLSGSITSSSITLLVHSSFSHSPVAQLISSSDTTGSELHRTSDPSDCLLLARIWALVHVLLSHTSTLALWRTGAVAAVAEVDTSSATAAVATDDASLTSVFTGAAKTAAPATTERGLSATPPLATAVAALIMAAPAAAVAVAACCCRSSPSLLPGFSSPSGQFLPSLVGWAFGSLLLGGFGGCSCCSSFNSAWEAEFLLSSKSLAHIPLAMQSLYIWRRRAAGGGEGPGKTTGGGWRLTTPAHVEWAWGEDVHITPSPVPTPPYSDGGGEGMTDVGWSTRIKCKARPSPSEEGGTLSEEAGTGDTAAFSWRLFYRPKLMSSLETVYTDLYMKGKGGEKKLPSVHSSSPLQWRQQHRLFSGNVALFSMLNLSTAVRKELAMVPQGRGLNKNNVFGNH